MTTIRRAFPYEPPVPVDPEVKLYDPIEAVTGIPAPETVRKPIAFRRSYTSFGSSVYQHYCAECDPRTLKGEPIGHVEEIVEADGWTVETGGKPRRCDCGAEIVDPTEKE